MTTDAPVTPPEPTGSPRSLRWAIGAGVVVLAAALLVVALTLPDLLGGRSPETTEPTPSADAAAARRIQATLYYLSDDGADLVPVAREVAYGETPADQVRHLMTAQLAAATDGHTSVFPEGVTVRGVFLGTRGEVYVDLSPEVSSAHVGGSHSEALAVFAIVNVITANLPDIRAVQILVDGQEVDSLAGHIDLRQPIGQAATWIRKGP
jgi:spore germination protein GerM